MSKFLSYKLKTLEPYTPGEQPKDFKYIKLNTNESPFKPSKKAIKMALKELDTLNLYPDPTSFSLHQQLALVLGVDKENVLATNGSDEILNFAFMAFCDDQTEAVFPDITYGFYEVFAKLYNIKYTKIPLNDDFTINVDDYIGINKTIFIANPNAPTGIALALSDIEKIVSSNPNNVVIIDEAYIDFGNESAIKLTKKYDNLLVTGTFSKSRSMAGARLGFGVGNKDLINDLNTIKYSTNPYNINKVTMAMGAGVLKDNKYTLKNCKKIIKNREYLIKGLKKAGFILTDSTANFVFCKHPLFSGEQIYTKLRENGILVRHFDKDKIKDYNRITIGSKKQMTKLLKAINNIVRNGEKQWEVLR